MDKIDDPKNDTIPSPPAPGARHDAAVLALHLAKTRIAQLVVDYALRAGVDTNARRMIEVLGCFEPVIAAISNILPEAAP